MDQHSFASAAGRSRPWFTGVFFACAFWLFLWGSSFGAAAPASQPLAEVNGETITEQELDQALGARLSKLVEQIYNLKRQELDRLIEEKLLAQEAAKRKTSTTALLDAEVTSKVGLVTESEIDDFYQKNKARLRGEESEVRQKIRPYLQQQKLKARRDAFVESLRARGKVITRLEPPPLVRVEVSIEGAPIRGAANAPVTLVEFSDFECPFCKRAHSTVLQVLERYKSKVKLAYRDFPLESIHPNARRAAEAARCANDQKKFWEYHDLLFGQNAKLDADSLKQYAKQVGLDVPKFESCLSSGVHKAGVQKDLDDGQKLGITGTPAFFVNGRLISGAQPFEAFAKVIDDELSRADRAQAPAR